jgi:hypothetical protein
MGVRVKLRIVIGGEVVKAIAFVNTWFETNKPQLFAP